MNSKQVLSAAALAGLLLAVGCSSEKTQETPSSMGECHGINSCKGTGACGGKGHSCAGQNKCKGKGWLKMTEKDCLEKGGSFSPK
jgi:hypothetical protein